MNINVLENKELLKRFCKDYRLPINILDPDIFTYFLELYDSTLHTKEKFKLFEETVKEIGGAQEFLDYYNDLKDKIINHIKEKESYIRFNSVNFEQFVVNDKDYPKKDIYNPSNDGKTFMSIDLTKANFQVFKNFDADIIDYKETYQEFFRQFTPYEYFIQSKYIRQVVFGNLNPGRQQTYEYFLTNKILKHIKEIFPKEKIRMFSADEIVVELDEVLNTELFYDIAKHENLVIDIEIFKLKTMLGKYTIKEFLNKDGFEIMCVPMDLKPQVLKKYLNLPLDDRDLLFYKDGKDGGFLCKYQTLLFPENKKRP